jgi:hypothetical protein
LKNRGVVHISFTRPPSVIRAPKGLAAFAIGFELKAYPSGNQNGPQSRKGPQE